MLKKNPQTVKIVYKNFPLRSHKFARKAAVAALAAERQGKFWSFHHELFQNYNKLDEEKIKAIASKLNLNQTQFEKDRQDPLLQEQVDHDVNEGIHAGVNSVPTVFINGRKLRKRSLIGFQELIDKELNSLKKKN